MTSQNNLPFQFSDAGPAVAGRWQLAAGRAISLRPRQAGMLRITQGRVWATLDGPQRGAGNESGDRFLQRGQRLPVGAGQHLVLEPWPDSGEAPVYFEWTPVAAAVTASAARWNAAVIEPLHEAGQAVLMAGSALGRLALGLAGYAEFLVAGRGRVLSKCEANPP
ncbi:MAG: DUF2917 domain-containing protein [Rhodoferax sp.]|uniref:DUF2917 domain-containing protein n=1 Tax=Rhodoferax sp. TaxID=50421 RepID=UPI00263055C9|nr:DUF2917 domain-containing protein [Rhodoferax sp.]MDD5332393.1 DUF2917 domain-containing protein [Rhodoferax sp.]